MTQSVDLLKQFTCYQRARMAAQRYFKHTKAGEKKEASAAALEAEHWYAEYQRAGGRDPLTGTSDEVEE